MKPVGRPRKMRHIGQQASVLQFSPRGKPGRPDEVALPADQLEAIRLADAQGLSQSVAAAQMAVSRATFGRILREARQRVARAITGGKIIRIVRQ